MTSLHRVALAAVLTAGLAAPAAAQSVTQSDIDRLQDNVYLAERDVTQLRSRDAARSTQLQSEVDDLRDEVIYLKVKLRKERTLARSEYAEVRDRIDDVRTRARGGESSASSGGSFSLPGTAAATGGSTTPGGSSTGSGASNTSSAGSSTATTTTTTPARQARPGYTEVPTGTELDVRMQTPLNSGTAEVEQRFEATTMADVIVGGRTVIPAGALMRGVVTGVERGTRTNRTSSMTLSFDQVTVSGRAYPIRGTVTEAVKGDGIRGEAGRAGVGAGVGAVLGAVLGGVKGAAIGAVLGGGGTIAATEGREVEVSAGDVLRVRIDSPVEIQTGGR